MHPETLIIKAVLFIRTGLPRLVRWVSSLSSVTIGSGVVIVALGIGVAIFMLRAEVSDLAPEAQIHTVTVRSVAELTSQNAPLSLVGSVSSKSEATVRAERSGQVVAVYKSLGDSVSAGAVAAEIENASERAAVLQAEGGVDAAQANLMKVSGGVRTEQKAILEANVANTTAALESARSAGLFSLLSAL